jgi:arylsulfatase
MREVLLLSVAPEPQPPWVPVYGTAVLSLNGSPVGRAAVAGVGFSIDTLDVGADLGSPVSHDYASPFAFSGRIETVTVELR